MDEELHRLIRDAKRGDPDVFAALVRRFKDQVYRYAYGMLGDTMEAEDVSQEAFVKCYASLSRLESEFAFASWLHRIVFNLCADRLKKRNREKTSAASASALAGMEQKEAREQYRAQQLKWSLEEAMAQLSPDHRQIILLHDAEGYRYEEIAQLLDIPVGTVKSRLNAARLSLRQAMKRGEP